MNRELSLLKSISGLDAEGSPGITSVMSSAATSRVQLDIVGEGWGDKSYGLERATSNGHWVSGSQGEIEFGDHGRSVDTCQVRFKPSASCHQFICTLTRTTFRRMASTESVGPSTQQKTAKELEDAKAMPPPPLPTKSIILEPELNALQDSLKVRTPCCSIQRAG